ncbi:MAG: hypothetical protein OXC69_08620 [Candidatus Tectomicrobia bacterium]|nr:hypothetical protein [Candidatus Tectomicrobia bacterium]
MSGMAVFSALGILAGLATLVCKTAEAFAVHFEGTGVIRDARAASGALRVAARSCIGLACLFALAALGELWLSLQGQENALDTSSSTAWGALWVHVLALLVEWRVLGLPGAGYRVVAGWLLAGLGVLFLGIMLSAWISLDIVAGAACSEGGMAIGATESSVNALAAFGLALVPLTGVALRLAGPSALLSSAAASVVVAAWLRPVLPGLGWLPLSSGGVLALLLVVSLLLLGHATARGWGTTVGGLLVYFGLTLTGCAVLGAF